MDLKAQLQERIAQAAHGLLHAEAPGAALPEIKIEVPRNREHGDFASNLAMQLTKALRRPPRQVAEQLVERIDRAGLIEEITIAGPGFINFKLATGATAAVLRRIADEGADYGRTETGRGTRILIEFVSANPTGPLHIGHARGAVVGDVVARILAAAGYDLGREYYFNDAGVQMDLLGNTLRLRVLQALGQEVEMPAPKVDPETGEEHAQYYKGEYMRDIAGRMIDELGPEEAGGEHETAFFTDYAVREILKTIDADLKALGIDFDSWFSETTLHRDGSVAESLEELRRLGHVYEKDGAQWLRSSDFGDEKDRVLVKSDGHYTYLTPDIAYHRHKFSRGYDRLIDVLGGDHHGYIPRLKASVQALGHPADSLKVVIIQMVSLLKDGVTMKLSTRSGKFLTLREAIEELGADVLRFFFAMRSPDSQMTFDWALAQSTSMDNPVYYVQYAHARCHSILRKAEESGLAYAGLDAAPLDMLEDGDEQALIRQLGRLPETVDAAARELAPHLMTGYLQDTAALFHGWFTRGTNDPALRCVREDAPQLTQARLALIDSLRQTLANGLAFLGISAPERM